MGKEIGIDFGTTNTVVSYVNKYDNLVTMSLTNSNDSIIPSVIYFNSKENYIIGSRALRKSRLKPSAAVKNFKSYFGEPKHKFHVKAENGDEFKLNSVQVASFFLREVIRNVQDKITNEFRNTPEVAYIDKVVISVPAKFNSVAISSVKKAAIAANISQVDLIFEPNAAAVAYIENHKDMERKNIIVYDFGGGTFDISLMEKRNDVYDVKYTGGDEKLGGNDLTASIARNMIGIVNDDFGLEMPEVIDDYDENYCLIDRESCVENLNKITNICNESIKHDLSAGRKEFTDEIPIIVGKNEDGEDEKKYFQYYYTKEDIYQMITPYIDRTIEKTKAALQKAIELNIKVDRIILAGGSSQIPIIEVKLRDMIKKFIEETEDEYKELFSELEVISDDDVSTLISKGAAIKANNNYKSIDFQNRTNNEFGIKIKNGVLRDMFKVIIPSGEFLPCSCKQEFALNDSVGGRLEIDIYERNIQEWTGENVSVRDRSVSYIDRLIISDTGLVNTPDAKALITFTAQKDGTVEVKADIQSGDRLISRNHFIRRESDLI